MNASEVRADQTGDGELPRYAASPEQVEGYSEVYKPGGPAFLGGKDVTDQLKDCAVCPKCGVYARANLVRQDGCFRCTPRRRQPAQQSNSNAAAVLVAAVLFGFGMAVGALLVLAIR